MITGYVRVSPRGAKMKGECATKDVTLAKCPLWAEWFHYPDLSCWMSAYFPFRHEKFHTRRTSFCHCIPIGSLSYFWRASTPSWVHELHLQAYPIGPLHGLLEGLIIQLIWFHVLYRQTLPCMHEQTLPLLLISFAHHRKARLLNGLCSAVATLRELSSKASRGNASAPATYCRMLGQTSGQTVMWLAYITSRLSTRCKSRTWCWTTWRKGSLNESKHCEFASDRRESAEESGVILNERERQRRGPGRIKQWREAQWEERNVNKVSMEGRICRRRSESGLKMKHNERISPEAQIEHFPFQRHQSRNWHVLLLLSLQFLLPTSVSKDMLSVRRATSLPVVFHRMTPALPPHTSRYTAVMRWTDLGQRLTF